MKLPKKPYVRPKPKVVGNARTVLQGATHKGCPSTAARNKKG